MKPITTAYICALVISMFLPYIIVNDFSREAAEIFEYLRHHPCSIHDYYSGSSHKTKEWKIYLFAGNQPLRNAISPLPLFVMCNNSSD